MTTPVESIVERFEEANATGNGELLASLYAPGATVWHNFDAREMPFEESLANFTEFHAQLVECTHEIRALLETSEGFVLQATTGGRVRSTGQRFVSHNCLVFTVVDGLIQHLDEYVDPSVWEAYGDGARPRGA